MKSFEERIWENTRARQISTMGGIRLNPDTAIQHQISIDNLRNGLDLQIVTVEETVEGKTYRAAESLTGIVPRRVYVWSPGKDVYWFTNPNVDRVEPVLGWPLDLPRQEQFEDWAVFDAYRDYGPHEGLDFYASIGDPVFACMDGVVIETQQASTGYGYLVVVQHDGGWTTWYAHLSSLLVRINDYVYRGHMVGYAGNTGYSKGPHLHLTVQHETMGRDGYSVPKVVDPQKYL